MTDDSSIATLVDRIKGRAAQLRPGDALPSTRVLIEEYRVSPVTVSRALSVLVAEGLVVTRPGAGTYVTGRRSQTPTNEADLAWQAGPLSDRTVDTSRLASLVQPPPEGVISLASGYPGADLVPTRALAAAVTRAARRSDVWDRPPAAGISGLRRWFARSVGGPIESDHVVITTGGQGALHRLSGHSAARRPHPRRIAHLSRRPRSRQVRRTAAGAGPRRRRRHPARSSGPGLRVHVGPGPVPSARLPESDRHDPRRGPPGRGAAHLRRRRRVRDRRRLCPLAVPRKADAATSGGPRHRRPGRPDRVVDQVHRARFSHWSTGGPGTGPRTTAQPAPGGRLVRGPGRTGSGSGTGDQPGVDPAPQDGVERPGHPPGRPGPGSRPPPAGVAHGWAPDRWHAPLDQVAGRTGRPHRRRAGSTGRASWWRPAGRSMPPNRRLPICGSPMPALRSSATWTRASGGWRAAWARWVAAGSDRRVGRLELCRPVGGGAARPGLAPW